MTGMEMPVKYVAEMFCDRLAACKTYHKGDYKDSDPYDFFIRGKDHTIFHENSSALLEKILLILRDQGEDAAFDYIRREVLHNAK